MSLLHKDTPKMSRLRAVPLFAEADHKALRHLAEAADEAKIEAGYELITEGHRHNEGYVIVEGSVAVSVDGHEVAVIGPGEMVGELALFGQTPASATVKCVTAVEALVIPATRFDQILDDNPGLGTKIARTLAARLHNMDVEYAQ